MVMAPHNETGAGVTASIQTLRDLLDELKHPAPLGESGDSTPITCSTFIEYREPGQIYLWTCN
jgi:hypothetical protein